MFFRNSEPLRMSLLIGVLMAAPPQAAQSQNGPEVSFPSHSAITLRWRNLDPGRVSLRARDYRIVSLAGSDRSHLLTPVSVGIDRRMETFDGNGQPVELLSLHLLMAEPLDRRRGSLLRLPYPLRPRSLLLEPASQKRSASIQLNQLGFMPCAPKYAYVGNWLGTAGPLPVTAERFQVVSKTNGQSVWEGPLALRATDDPWSGHHVYQADFSGLRTPGVYTLEVPGIGASAPFRIDAQVYEPAYRTTARLFYHSRNSTPILAPYAEPGFERPEGGVPNGLDGVFHPAVAETPLHGTEVPGDYHAAGGGWFDAGDYGQYIPNAAPVWFAVGVAMDTRPGNFRDGDLGIPESGNGVPDILDEISWGMHWALRMQDPADGGVWFRLASERWDDVPPHLVSRPRYIYEKTTHASASFAAMAAIHARLLAPYRPEEARTALSAARNAWRFLQRQPDWPAEGQEYQNPPGTAAGRYGDRSALDNKLWAAAELLRSTGEAQYARAYELLFPQVHLDPTHLPSYKRQEMAALWAYSQTRSPEVDPQLLELARKALLSAADWRLRMADQNPFRAAVHHHLPFLGWGSFGHSGAVVLSLLQAHALTGRAEYPQWATVMTDPQLGANPLGLSFVTGVGLRSPRDPLSKLSQFDANEDPLPGIPVNGPHYQLPAAWAALKLTQAAYIPPASNNDGQPVYPALRRFTDSALLPPMTEPTVAAYAYTAVAFGLLRQPLRQQCETGPESASDHAP